MKVRVLKSLSTSWHHRALVAGEEIEVPDFREATCRDLRILAKRGDLVILTPQKRPDYSKARAEVHP